MNDDIYTLSDPWIQSHTKTTPATRSSEPLDSSELNLRSKTPSSQKESHVASTATDRASASRFSSLSSLPSAENLSGAYVSPNSRFRKANEKPKLSLASDKGGEQDGKNKGEALPGNDMWKPLDDCTVEVSPRKIGLVFKHTNYSVTSSRWQTSVLRRYSDFLWLLNYLVAKYPFRLLPGLPPKSLQLDAQALERRRQALQRFLQLINYHPILAQDQVVHRFLKQPTFSRALSMNVVEEFEDEGLHEGSPTVIDSPVVSTVLTTHKDRIPVDLDDRLDSFLAHLAAHQERVSKLVDCSLKELECFQNCNANCTESAQLWSDWGELLDPLGLDDVSRERWTTASHEFGRKLSNCQTTLTQAANGFERCVVYPLCTLQMWVNAAQDLFERVAKTNMDKTIGKVAKRVLEHQSKILEFSTKLQALKSDSDTFQQVSGELLKLQSMLEQDSLKLAELKQREICLRYALWHEYQLFHIGSRDLHGLVLKGWEENHCDYFGRMSSCWTR